MTVESASVRLRHIHKVVLAVGSVVVCLGLAACGGSDEPVADPTPSTTDLPTSTPTTVILPTGWDAPEPTSAVLAAASANDGVLVATFTGTGELKLAADTYAQQLQAAGWKADENNIINANSIWFKGDRRLDLSGTETQTGRYDLVITVEPKA